MPTCAADFLGGDRQERFFLIPVELCHPQEQELGQQKKADEKNPTDAAFRTTMHGNLILPESFAFNEPYLS